jgi:hypothetical protein
MNARRHRRCNHLGYEITAAYTMTGVGRWRSIVWCARCGALGFRDHENGREVREEWRRPTSRARRGAPPAAP